MVAIRYYVSLLLAMLLRERFLSLISFLNQFNFPPDTSGNKTLKIALPVLLSKMSTTY